MTHDFRETKIKILSEEHSRAFQEAVLEAGGRWSEDSKFHHTLENYLYVNNDLVLDWGITTSFFESHEYREIQFPTPTKGHPLAELMQQYAEDAKTHAEPWKLWQIHCAGDVWHELGSNPTWVSGLKYRRKPKTKLVHGVEVPVFDFVPCKGNEYFIADTTAPDLIRLMFMPARDCKVAELMYSRGLTYPYSTEGRQAAILHARAMLNIE